MTRNNEAASLVFELREESLQALKAAAERSDDSQNCDNLEFSYRAWNASFVSCSEAYSIPA